MLTFTFQLFAQTLLQLLLRLLPMPAPAAVVSGDPVKGKGIV
jgi:hypothetical protein